MLIAEVSSNHSRSLERCIHFVERAKQCGFDAIKFQLFRIDELFIKEVLDRSAKHAARRQWEFPREFLKPLREACNRYNIKLGITPFYLDAVEEAVDYVDFFKVASYELMWLNLHEAIMSHNKPTIISTGMAKLDEVMGVKKLYDANGFDAKKLTFLHCESNYPANIQTINLEAINTMRRALGCDVGWSDHTKDIDVVCNAIFGFGATTVEMHFDLDGTGEEAAGGHCWLPTDIEALTKKIQKFSDMQGDGVKEPAISELNERNWRADPSDGLRPTKKIRNNLGL